MGCCHSKPKEIYEFNEQEKSGGKKGSAKEKDKNANAKNKDMNGDLQSKDGAQTTVIEIGGASPKTVRSSNSKDDAAGAKVQEAESSKPEAESSADGGANVITIQLEDEPPTNEPKVEQQQQQQPAVATVTVNATSPPSSGPDPDTGEVVVKAEEAPNVQSTPAVAPPSKSTSATPASPSGGKQVIMLKRKSIAEMKEELAFKKSQRMSVKGTEKKEDELPAKAELRPKEKEDVKKRNDAKRKTVVALVEVRKPEEERKEVKAEVKTEQVVANKEDGEKEVKIEVNGKEPEVKATTVPEINEPAPDYDDDGDDEPAEEDYVKLRRSVKNRISAILTREDGEWEEVYAKANPPEETENGVEIDIPEPDYDDNLKTKGVTRSHTFNAPQHSKILHSPVGPGDTKAFHELQREIAMNQKLGVDVLHRKSELRKEFDKRKEREIQKETEKTKPTIEQTLQDTANKLKQTGKKEASSNQDHSSTTPTEDDLNQPEFLRVHSKIYRAKSTKTQS